MTNMTVEKLTLSIYANEIWVMKIDFESKQIIAFIAFMELTF